jgi:hypothetical protein
MLQFIRDQLDAIEEGIKQSWVSVLSGILLSTFIIPLPSCDVMLNIFATLSVPNYSSFWLCPKSNLFNNFESLTERLEKYTYIPNIKLVTLNS